MKPGESAGDDDRRLPGGKRRIGERLAGQLKSTTVAGVPAPRNTGHAGQVDGALVAVVHTGEDRCRRRVFLTLAAAERAVRRAEDAGHPASVVLCRLAPVEVVA